MPDQEKAGFEIRGRFYPMPDAFRLCDPVLVEEVTGLEFSDFAARLDAQGEAARAGDGEADPVLLPGLVGVAVWQLNSRWSRDKVIRFVQGVQLDEITMHAGADDEEPAEEGAQRPPDGSSSTLLPTSEPPVEANV